MSEFQTYTCWQCGEAFTAVPGAKAAERESCSPRCERLAGREVAADD